MAAAAAPTRLSLPHIQADWARQGVESLTAALKIVSDLTAQEIALVVGMIRERIPENPIDSVAQITGQAVTGVIDAAKILLDLAATESALAADGLKQVLGLRPSLAALTDLFPLGVGTLVDMEKKMLDAAAEETEGLVEFVTDGKPLMPRARAAKLAREALEGFIETQKKLLDQFADQVILATEGGHKASRAEAKAFTSLAREAIEKFIDAQKDLLQIAVAQMEAGEKRAHGKPVSRTSFTELTQKSVRNLTSAQKSLLDLAVKPVRKAVREAEEETHVKPRRRPKRKAKAVAAQA